ncbi:radical SAM protein [Fervidobacterium nodosum]|uniref:Radical SAM domain protein n=2 Tax=Fervidobacterium TaxID=2422 RepID=A7HKB3_FERNB|nr:Radical SAM domain protein [Fervidobacterium nodosum Rt17-B1]KAF2961383.1 radical SAM protein [Fervidobacterium sp. 2310opik-2]
MEVGGVLVLKDLKYTQELEIIEKYGKEDIAMVYLGKTRQGALVEFVESVQPPIPRDKKWVLIVSTMDGCPVGCKMCDAGGYYKRRLSKEEILAQILYLIRSRYEDEVPVEKFKIQFARVGEPALNDEVLKVLDELPQIIDAPGLMPSISTVAPIGRNGWFERLIEIKEKHYRGKFQLQFSIHSTDEKQRDEIIPVKKWSFREISEYGEKFVTTEDRKITLNFALAKENIADARVIMNFFNPEKFLIKITPVNPTYRSIENGLNSDVTGEGLVLEHREFVDKLRESGYDVIISVGELEENKIGSNCGQYVQRHLNAQKKLEEAYTFVKEE